MLLLYAKLPGTKGSIDSGASHPESPFPRQPDTPRVEPESHDMEVRQNPGPLLNTIDLLNAVLCADCEVISDSAGEVCAVCGSRSLLSLGRVLGGSIGEERAVLVSAPGQELRNMFTLLVNPDAATTLRPSRRWIRTERLEKSGS